MPPTVDTQYIFLSLTVIFTALIYLLVHRLNQRQKKT
jgi:hypothetical protein